MKPETVHTDIRGVVATDRTARFMSEIVRKGPIAHISIHFAAEELVGIWMKYRVISKTLYKEIDEAGFFPTYTELRPMPHVDGLSPALRGSQILYIEVQPREAVFHE